MTHPSEVGRPAAPIDRQTVEADLTRGRIVELQLQPVVGAFDASHLKEVNRRIFQDLPGRGFAAAVLGVSEILCVRRFSELVIG